MDEFATSEMAPSIPVEEESWDPASSSQSGWYSQPIEKKWLSKAEGRYEHYRSNISTIQRESSAKKKIKAALSSTLKENKSYTMSASIKEEFTVSPEPSPEGFIAVIADAKTDPW